MENASQPINQKVTNPWQLPEDLANNVHKLAICNRFGDVTIPGLFREAQLSQVCKANSAFVRSRTSIYDGRVFVNRLEAHCASVESYPTYGKGGHMISLRTGNHETDQYAKESLCIVRDTETRMVYCLFVLKAQYCPADIAPFDWAVVSMYNMIDCLRILSCHHVRSPECAINTTPGKLDLLSEAKSTGDGCTVTLTFAQTCGLIATQFRCKTIERKAMSRKDSNKVLRTLVEKPYNDMAFHIKTTNTTLIIPNEEADESDDPFIVVGQGAPTHSRRIITFHTMTNGIRIFDDITSQIFWTEPTDSNKYSELPLIFGAEDYPEICSCNGIVDHEFIPGRYDIVKKRIHRSLWPRADSIKDWEVLLFDARADQAAKKSKEVKVRGSKKKAASMIDKEIKRHRRLSYDGRVLKGAYTNNDSDSSELEEYNDAKEFEKRHPHILDDRYGNSSEEERNNDFDSDDSCEDKDYKQSITHRQKSLQKQFRKLKKKADFIREQERYQRALRMEKAMNGLKDIGTDESSS